MEDTYIDTIPHFTQTLTTEYDVHAFYISETITDLDNYVNLIHTLRTVGPDDSVHIFISSPGGSLNVGQQIINAMTTTVGKVTTILDGEACSMAAIIFLAGHQKSVQRYSRLMLHNFSAGMYGKGHELASTLQSTKEMSEELMTDVCKGFLTKKELKQMFDGKDFWFSPDEIIQRLNK